MSTGQEYIIGALIGGPSKSGECAGYSESLPGVTWDALLTVMASQKLNNVEIMFLGKAGSDGKCGSTGFGIVDRSDIQHAAFVVLEKHPEFGASVTKVTKNANYTGEIAQVLLYLSVPPSHIVGVIIREII